MTTTTQKPLQRLAPTQPDAPSHDLSFVNKGPLGYLKELWNRFNADQCAVWAAALSFFALLSIIPLMVGGIAILGFLIRDPQTAAAQVQELVARLLPSANASEIARRLIVSANIEEQARRLMESRGWAGLIGLGSFLFTASRIFVNAAPPMNAAFRAEESRGLIKINLYALGLLLGTGLLALLSLLPTYGMNFLRQVPFFSGWPDPTPWWLDLLLLLVSIAINAGMFTMIYRFLPSPRAKVTWKMALVGGGVVAVVWEIAKQGFALYLRNLGGGNTYDQAYGSLGGVAVLVLWIHLSSQLLLMGAEIARLYADAIELRQRGKSTPAGLGT